MSIVERLRMRPEDAVENLTDVIADRFAEVTVLFADHASRAPIPSS